MQNFLPKKGAKKLHIHLLKMNMQSFQYVRKPLFFLGFPFRRAHTGHSLERPAEGILRSVSRPLCDLPYGHGCCTQQLFCLLHSKLFHVGGELYSRFLFEECGQISLTYLHGFRRTRQRQILICIVEVQIGDHCGQLHDLAVFPLVYLLSQLQIQIPRDPDPLQHIVIMIALQSLAEFLIRTRLICSSSSSRFWR